MAFSWTLPILFATTETPFDVAGDIVNDAAVELGLSEAVEDPFDETDANFVQLCRLLKTLGRELWRKYDWGDLQQEATLTTEAGVYQYALPADYGRQLSQTAWNRSTRFPATPVSPRQWQQLQAQATTSTLNVLYRVRQQQVELASGTSTAAGEDIRYEYISRFWVQSTEASAPDKDAPTAGSDVIWFDPLLMVRGLKLAFLRAKGFDTTSAEADYRETLELVMGGDGAAPVLQLGGGSRDVPLLGPNNIPITGFGGS